MKWLDLYRRIQHANVASTNRAHVQQPVSCNFGSAAAVLCLDVHNTLKKNLAETYSPSLTSK
jgi:hypothetical protein